MIRALVLLWRVLFHRPLIFILLLMVYGVAAFLGFGVDSPKKGLAVAVLSAFAAAGLAAVLTERLSRYSLQAGAIGLPGHGRLMHRVQACFLVLFVGAPAALALLLGAAPLPTLAALVTATAAGIVLAAYGSVWIILVPLLGKFAPLGAWAQLAPVQALATIVGGFVISRWFGLPEKAERAGGFADARLADATHERLGRTEPPADSAGDGEFRMLSNAVAADLESGRRLTDVLAIGLGYSVGISRRALLIGVSIVIALLAAWRMLHGSQPSALAYGIVTAVCCFSMVSRLQTILQRLMRTSTEQALLQLTPRWPGARLVKKIVIGTTLLVQRGSIAVWLAASAAAAPLGSIGGAELLWGMLAMLGTSLAFSGAAWAVLAHRRIREWHVSTIVLVLTVYAGATTMVFGGTIATGLWIFGAAMMIFPPALALAAYLWVPLRFPLNVDPRALKAAL